MSDRSDWSDNNLLSSRGPGVQAFESVEVWGGFAMDFRMAIEETVSFGPAAIRHLAGLSFAKEND